MAHPKPTILIVPETWCTPPLYAPLSRPLEQAGYRVRTAFLPSIGARPVCKRGTEDIETLTQTIRYCADRGEEVLIVAHGAGGAAAGDAVRGLLRIQRRKGGVIGIVFIAGLVLDIEECVEGFLGEEQKSWEMEKGDGWDLAKAEKIFAGMDLAVVAANGRHLKPSALSPRRVETMYAGWRDVPCWYLVCERDQIIHQELQDAFVVGRLKGPQHEIETIDAGHFPFLEERWVGFVVGFVRRAAGERI